MCSLNPSLHYMADSKEHDSSYYFPKEWSHVQAQGDRVVTRNAKQPDVLCQLRPADGGRLPCLRWRRHRRRRTEDGSAQLQTAQARRSAPMHVSWPRLHDRLQRPAERPRLGRRL